MKKRTTFVLAAVLLVAAVLAGATLAWQNYTDQKVNTFSYAVGGTPDNHAGPVAIQVREPKWSPDDPFQFTAYARYNDPTGTKSGPAIPSPWASKPATDPDWGINKAKNFKQGQLIDKNPSVRAIGYLPTYVGMIVSGEVDAAGAPASGALTLAELEKIYKINWQFSASDVAGYPATTTSPANKWRLVHVDTTTGHRYFVWDEPLYPADALARYPGRGYPSGQDRTAELFTTVEIMDRSVITTPAIPKNDDIYDAISGTSPKNCDIVLRGFAVQAENDKYNNWSALVALAEEFRSGGQSGRSDWEGIGAPAPTP